MQTGIEISYCLAPSVAPNNGKWLGENEYGGSMIFKGFNIIREKMVGYINNILGVIIILIITTFNQSCKNRESGLSSYKELRDNIIVVDSLRLYNNDSLFWYCIDLGIQGYSDGKVGIARNRYELETNAKIVVVSNEITSIKILANDTLQISFYSDHKFSGIVQKIDHFKYIKLNKAGGYKDLIVYRIEH